MSKKIEILTEENYRRRMQEEVEPYLAARERQGQILRDREKPVYYVSYEPDGEKKGVIMISHGFTETAEKYKEIIYYFLLDGYVVYMPEHCCHGHSYRFTEDLSLVHVDDFMRYVKDFVYLAELAKKETKLPILIYAHSMGGGVAAAALSEKPELFERAVLSSPMIRPQTGDIPWKVTRLTASFMCLIGKKMNYVPGAGPFDGKETYEDSASLSPERFAYYLERKKNNPLYQMSGASYGWLREAGKLNAYLRKRAAARIKCPILLFQAGLDAYVSAEEQDYFVKKLRENGNSSVNLVKVPGVKHEIYNSGDEVLKKYWNQVFDFINNREK